MFIVIVIFATMVSVIIDITTCDSVYDLIVIALSGPYLVLPPFLVIISFVEPSRFLIIYCLLLIRSLVVLFGRLLVFDACCLSFV